MTERTGWIIDPTCDGFWWLSSTEAPSWMEVVQVELERGIYWRPGYDDGFKIGEDERDRFWGPITRH